MAMIKQLHEYSDEVDLLSILQKVVSFIKTYGKMILIFSVAGLALGILKYANSPKKYASRLILHTTILSNQEQIEIINNWKNLLKKREYTTLAGILECDIPTVKKLKKITASDIQKTYSQTDPNGFFVDVLVLDTGVLDVLQKGIVQGLGNSDYVKERMDVKRASLNTLLTKVKGEITNLDSTKKIIRNIITHKNPSSSSIILDVTGINAQWMGMNEKLIGYQEELNFIRPVQVLQGFNKLSKPEEPSLLRTLFFSIVIFGFIGYSIALYKHLRRLLKNSAAPDSPATIKQHSVSP